MPIILLRKCNFELYMTATEMGAGAEKASMCSLWQKVIKNRYGLYILIFLQTQMNNIYVQPHHYYDNEETTYSISAYKIL